MSTTRTASRPSRAVPVSDLLRAAREEIVANGLHVPMEQIAARAGVTRVTLYRHFGSRDDLLAALLADEAHHLSHRVGELLGDLARPFPERLVDVLGHIVPAVRRSVFLAAFLDQRPAGALTGPALDAFGHRLRSFFRPYFQDPSTVAQLRNDPDRTLDWLFRVTLLQLVAPPFGDPDEAAWRAELVQFVLPSVLTPAAVRSYLRRQGHR